MPPCDAVSTKSGKGIEGKGQPGGPVDYTEMSRAEGVIAGNPGLVEGPLGLCPGRERPCKVRLSRRVFLTFDTGGEVEDLISGCLLHDPLKGRGAGLFRRFAP